MTTDTLTVEELGVDREYLDEKERFFLAAIEVATDDINRFRAKQSLNVIRLAKAGLESRWRTDLENAPKDKSILMWWKPIRENKDAEAAVIGQISSHEPGKWWNGQTGHYQSLEHIAGWQPLPSPPERGQ